MAAVGEFEQQESGLRDYGPPILGAVIILAILVGGWYLWRTRVAQPEPNPSPGIVEEVVEPSPLPSPEATDSGDVNELPEAGFPAGVAIATSLLALAAGWKLRRNS